MCINLCVCMFVYVDVCVYILDMFIQFMYIQYVLIYSIYVCVYMYVLHSMLIECFQKCQHIVQGNQLR